MNPVKKMMINAIIFGISCYAIGEAIEHRIKYGEAGYIEVWLAIISVFAIIFSVKGMLDSMEGNDE